MKSAISALFAVTLAICAVGALGNDWYDDDHYGQGYYPRASVYPSYAQKGYYGYAQGGVNTVIRQPYPYPVPAAGGLGFGAGVAVGSNNGFGGGLFGGQNPGRFSRNFIRQYSTLTL